MRSGAALPHADSNVVELADGIVQGTYWPLIPDAEYQAAFIKHVCIEVEQFRFQPKLYMHFRIVSPGEHFGIVLYRSYRLRSILSEHKKGAPVVNGRFTLAARSQLLLDYCRLMEVKTRPDRVSLRSMQRHLFRIRTMTVTTNYRQKDIPAVLRYSIVEDILERETG